MKKKLPEFIDLQEIKSDITTLWLPVEELGVLLYRKWVERGRDEVENLIVWVKTAAITESDYFELLENFFPEGLDEEGRKEHSRLFNSRYKDINYHLCEISRHPKPDSQERAFWQVGEARRRVVFNRAFKGIPTNLEIEQFLQSHWNAFYYELRKRPRKYKMLVDGINTDEWSTFNGEQALKAFELG